MGQELRTDLARVKGLGAAKEGSSHWIWQRITAIALIPLTIWFIIIVLRLCKSNFQDTFILLKSPCNFICFILFICFSLYHGALGVQVIVEDYVHSKLLKRILLLVLFFISVVTAIAVLCALLIFHVSTFYLA